MAGQVANHLLAQAGAARAPWPITTLGVILALPTTSSARQSRPVAPVHRDATGQTIRLR
jgi:hypothetical protein